MELNKLKAFAQKARNDLYTQIKSALDLALQENGQLQLHHPKVYEKLQQSCHQEGREQVIRKVAYYWFNRFCALRYMDLKGYTSSKVVSAVTGQGTIPEILTEVKSGYFAPDLVTPALQDKITDLLNNSLSSVNPDAEIYRLLLIAACNYWHRNLPFLFQAEDDYTEYLLPLDLLSKESILQDIREALTAENCESVEIIGWLYQYYISERKDEIFAALKKNQKIEPQNIPAATQLFTPEWIVRYLVENSLGRLWMLNHPDSRLIESMEYYINPAEPETDFLKVSTPQEIKLCDPCCGSGHMLVYAFELLYKIYEEQGYLNSEIPKLILDHNLYGLELDERASVLASFALMMKAREKDRRIFSKGVTLHICRLERLEFSDGELHEYQYAQGITLPSDLLDTLQQFAEADNFGSLIVPKTQRAQELLDSLRGKEPTDIHIKDIHDRMVKALTAAKYLSGQYHVVVTNPPYMGVKSMNGRLASWVKDEYPEVKSDLFSAFIVRCLNLAKYQGYLGFMSPFVWMFISSYEKLRYLLTLQKTIISLIQLEYSGFDGATVPICTFTLQNSHVSGYKGAFIKLSDFRGSSNQGPKALEAIKNPECSWFYLTSAENFKKIPGSPIAYWLSDRFIKVFETCPRLDSYCKPAQGLATSDNNRFLRQWYEVAIAKIGFGKVNAQDALASGCKWFPYNKGGEYRRWYGNHDYVIDWEDDGAHIKNFCFSDGKQRSVIRNPDCYFKPSITWTDISSSFFAARLTPQGFLFDVSGSSIFPTTNDIYFIAGMMESSITSRVLKVLNPTMHFQVGNIASLPLPSADPEKKALISSNASMLIDYHMQDWDAYETSWNFKLNPLIKTFRDNHCKFTLEHVTDTLQKFYKQDSELARKLEELNNHYFIELYGLEREVRPDYPLSEVTLFGNTAFMYPGKTDKEAQALQRADLIRDLISYAVGCMFGRYSLDKPGLILCNQGEGVEDFNAQVTNSSFEVDDDNVIPVLTDSWFSDDIVERFKIFLKTAFGEEHFIENLRFIENTLNVKDKASYSIRDYFVGEFYADHVRRYKKRPIYWMFKSPKGYFKALIYLHRYQPYTVSRTRSEYLLEFRNKLDAEMKSLNALLDTYTLSKGESNAKQKRIDEIKKIIADLNDYDSEIMYPLAQQNIKLDLDDGVKVNYVKFGKALEKIPGLDKKEE